MAADDLTETVDRAVLRFELLQLVEDILLFHLLRLYDLSNELDPLGSPPFFDCTDSKDVSDSHIVWTVDHASERSESRILTLLLHHSQASHSLSG